MGKTLKTQTTAKKFDWIFVPVVFVLIFVPMMLRVTRVEVDPMTARLYGSYFQYDIYAPVKAVCLAIGAIVMLIMALALFCRLFEKKEWQTNVYFIAGGVFILFTLLSAVFSDNKSVAFLGFFSHGEGFITLLSYMIIFLYTFLMYRETRNFRYIIVPLIIVVVLNAILGIMQFAGNDLLQTDFGKSLVIPQKYKELVQDFSYDYKNNKIYGTLSHYNYMGSFSAMMLPLFTVLTLTTKEMKNRIIFAGSAVVSALLLFGSTARAGLIGLTASIIFVIIVFAKQLISHWKISVSVLVAGIVVAIGLNAATKGVVFARVPSMIQDAFAIFTITEKKDYRDELPVRDIINNADGTMSYVAQNDILTLSYDGEKLYFTNQMDVEVAYTETEEGYKIIDPAFSGYEFLLGRSSETATQIDVGLFRYQGKIMTYFRILDEYQLHLASGYGYELIDLDKPQESEFFKGKEKLGSMRGYIWGRTLPMLKECFIVGYGPDNYVFQFPQNDLLGKYYAYDTTNMIIAKPHNVFLQIFVNNGGIAFLAFIAIIGVYIVDCLRLYCFKKKYSQEQGIGIALFAAVIGYLAAGLFNDSMSYISVVFWILLGCGAAVNYSVRKSPKAEAADLTESKQKRVKKKKA